MNWTPTNTMKFSALSLTIISALALTVTAGPATIKPRLVSEGEVKNWLANTDANITYVGGPADSGLGSRDFATTTVVSCDKRTADICGGTCKVYTGGPTCLDVPGTSCLMATSNVGFCDKGGCGGSCNQFSTCGTRLPSGFCFTPGTRSILVGA
ncbi:hypothetical protein BDZ94DRAFT_345774 [Collybia nuda]|uniref:Uncharacterized protein n=1 Tax=Collybia nuda TaxID=64659 RepID=A0A9P5YB60_9AGAR|nr:hypothetical protein BDZ94DRAFT_345774 [Collybia nuda]